MATFIDVHEGMKGITVDQLREGLEANQNLEGGEGVHFIKAWADPGSGKVFCLSEGPSKDAVGRIHDRSGHKTDAIYELSLQVE